eukprot:PhF_6_TR35446/c0_g1_i2/m.51711
MLSVVLLFSLSSILLFPGAMAANPVTAQFLLASDGLTYSRNVVSYFKISSSNQRGVFFSAISTSTSKRRLYFLLVSSTGTRVTASTPSPVLLLEKSPPTDVEFEDDFPSCPLRNYNSNGEPSTLVVFRRTFANNTACAYMHRVNSATGVISVTSVFPGSCGLTVGPISLTTGVNANNYAAFIKDG